jgi:hypothetical protein
MPEEALLCLIPKNQIRSNAVLSTVSMAALKPYTAISPGCRVTPCPVVQVAEGCIRYGNRPGGPAQLARGGRFNLD